MQINITNNRTHLAADKGKRIVTPTNDYLLAIDFAIDGVFNIEDYKEITEEEYLYIQEQEAEHSYE